MNTYLRISKGLNSYSLVPANTDIQQIINSNPGLDYYESIYQYNEKHYNQWKQTKSVSGIKDVKTNKIVFDFDSKSDIDLAKNDAIELCNRLLSSGLKSNELQIYFSGGKGFHVQLSTEDLLTRKELENVLKTLGKNLNTLDTKITDEQRLIRIPMTKHQKTGALKIPLTFEQLKQETSESILNKAKQAEKDPNPFFDIMDTYKVIKLPESVLKIKESKETTEETKKEVKQVNIDFDERPKFLSKSKYALLKGFFEDGERHDAMMILASTFRGLGFPQEVTEGMLRGALQLHYDRTGLHEFDEKELQNNILGFVYGSRWQGGTYSDKETPLLQKIVQRFDIKSEDTSKPVEFFELGGDSFKRYAKSFYETRIYTGLDDLDEAFPICAGSNVAIVGAASSGKTALSLNILKQMKETGAVSVFASLDMSKSRLYEKLLYSVTQGKLTRDQLYQAYINGEGKKYDILIKEQFPNTFIFAKSSPTVDELKAYLNKVQDFTGKPVRLLLIDYFERLNSEKSDDTSASKDIASGIQDLIADFPELTPVTLYQPNKFALGGGPDKPILNYTAIKGSSFIFQAARQILSIWRPFFTPEMKDYDNYIEMAILKNDLGELDKFCYSWEGKTGRILKMTEEQRYQYNEFMAEKDALEKKSFKDI